MSKLAKSILFEPEQLEYLDKEAKDLNLSRNEAIAEAIALWLQIKKKQKARTELQKASLMIQKEKHLNETKI